MKIRTCAIRKDVVHLQCRVQATRRHTKVQHESVLLILADKSVATNENGMKVGTLRVIVLTMAEGLAIFHCFQGRATHLIGKEIEAALALLCSTLIFQI